MIRNALQRFMYGRYGNDQLNLFLLGAYFVFFLLSAIFHSGLLSLLGEVCLILALFRLLSRNLAKRRSENALFLKKATPVLQWMRLQKNIHKDRTHRYFRCPRCRQAVRVPRGRGKINIRCPKCSEQFIKRT